MEKMKVSLLDKNICRCDMSWLCEWTYYCSKSDYPTQFNSTQGMCTCPCSYFFSPMNMGRHLNREWHDHLVIDFQDKIMGCVASIPKISYMMNIPLVAHAAGCECTELISFDLVTGWVISCISLQSQFQKHLLPKSSILHMKKSLVSECFDSCFCGLEKQISNTLSLPY